MSWTLVTGGSKRLGATLCRHLASSGYHIVVHYHQSNQEALKIVEECLQFGVRAESIQGDFSTEKSTQKFIEDYLKRFSQTSHIINNVGNYTILSALQTPLVTWLDLFQTNFFAPLAIIQALIPSLKKTHGQIINLGTAGLDTQGADCYSTAYTTTKMSLWLLTKSLARELAPFDVRVNMVSPGVLDNTVDPPDSPLKLPMKRMGTTDEVARVVTFLLDPKSAYITGQNIEVAGAVGL